MLEEKIKKCRKRAGEGEQGNLEVTELLHVWNMTVVIQRYASQDAQSYTLNR